MKEGKGINVHKRMTQDSQVREFDKDYEGELTGVGVRALLARRGDATSASRTSAHLHPTSTARRQVGGQKE